MKTRFTLLAAVTVLGLGIAPAFAANAGDASGYVYPDFWGNVPAHQQAPSAPAPVANKAEGASIGTYVTQTSHGTWLFPPNPYSGANS